MYMFFVRFFFFTCLSRNTFLTAYVYFYIIWNNFAIFGAARGLQEFEDSFVTGIFKELYHNYGYKYKRT